MKTILISAYAVNPYKGSENGMGWRFIEETAREFNVIAITRENNIPAIQQFVAEQDNPLLDRIEWHGYDLPAWARWWKKGEWLALFYYVLWQRFLPRFVRKNRFEFDLTHALNFHNDWTPSFLWKLGKPFIWGPIGHHPPIPKEFIKPFYGTKAWLSDVLKSGIKASFRNFIPGLRRTAKETDHIFAMHPGVAPRLGLKAHQYSLLPSVGTEWVPMPERTSSNEFSLISVGRFVPLKGFDISIRAFAHFYKKLSKEQAQHTKLRLVGKGPEKHRLQALVQSLDMEEAIEFIEWMPREDLLKQYSKAAAFLFPSHEGAGMVVAEALSFGLPVVCIDNVGPGAFVTDDCGLKAPYALGYNAVCEQLGEHLFTLYSMPEMQSAMSEAARMRFENHFDWKEKGKQMREVYHRFAPQTLVEA